MNANVTRALDQTPTGDLIKYFALSDNILEANSGVHDNKCLSIDAADPPCPVNRGMYTKLKLTDESVQITNIDKSSITALVSIDIKAADKFWLHSDFNYFPDRMLVNDSRSGNGQDGSGDSAMDSRDKLMVWFVGLKASSHLFDAYRVYSNNRKTACEQTESLYENAAARILKAQEELDYKPGIYTQWRSAREMGDNVCGAYFSLYELKHAPNGVLNVQFEATIPVDDFLPFSGMTLFPNALFGNLSLEVKMAIQQNFVITQVDTDVVMKRHREVNVDSTGVIYSNFDSIAGLIAIFTGRHETSTLLDTQSFTQIGDTFISSYIRGWLEEDAPLGALWPIKTTFQITSGKILNCRSNLNGFNVKNDVLDQLYEKFSQQDLIIPAQYVDYQAFSQKPLSNGLKCNTTYGLTNACSLMFLFPRTTNDLTCSKNPLFSSLQMQIDNRPYPDKPFSSIEQSHTIFNITNAGLDGLFSPSEEFGYSLTCNELKTRFGDKNSRALKDNTSYCFLCATERLSGYGTFCDGVTKESAHITLSATLLPHEGVHPYLNNPLTMEKNERGPIMLVCQDAFWNCSVAGGCEFICNDKNYVKEKTGTV